VHDKRCLCKQILYWRLECTEIGCIFRDQRQCREEPFEIFDFTELSIHGRINVTGGFYMKIVNFKKVMIATDGSDYSKIAVDKGIELARLSGGTVYAVYVVPTAYLYPMDGDYFMGMNPYWESIYEALKTHGQQAVNYVKGAGEVKGVIVEPVLLEGNPADELIRYAEENEMDIIVMGTLGKTGLDRLLLGSVTGNVIRHSKIPVMVVRDKGNS
jgi:nucleotide-binding universal stress UspA family protein